MTKHGQGVTGTTNDTTRLHAPVACSACAMPITRSDREMPRRRIIRNAMLMTFHFIVRGETWLLVPSSPPVPIAADANSSHSGCALAFWQISVKMNPPLSCLKRQATGGRWSRHRFTAISHSHGRCSHLYARFAPASTKALRISKVDK